MDETKRNQSQVPVKSLHDALCNHNYTMSFPPDKLYFSPPSIPIQKEELSVALEVRRIILGCDKFFKKKINRFTFTMAGVTRYKIAFDNKSTSSFLHKWKNQSQNNPVISLRKGSMNRKPNFVRFLSMPCDDLSNLKLQNSVNIKIICRDFILSERYCSLIQTGNLEIFKDDSINLNYKNTYDTSFLLQTDKNKNKRKTFGGHSKTSNKHALSKTLLRPLSVNFQVRLLSGEMCLQSANLSNSSTNSAYAKIIMYPSSIFRYI